MAVSGGPDSLALLLLAHAALPGRIAVASVDHGLRAEAAGEVAMVEALCAERGIPFTALAVEVPRGNLQSRAREARYEALARWVREQGCGALATAHHADDQAETLLMRLARGSGLAGLAGVRAHGHVPGSEILLVRPLLSWRKRDLETVVAAAGIEPARDPSNEDEAFDRVRVRRHLAQHDWLDPQALAESAGHLAEAWRAIEWYAQLDFEEMVHREDVPDGPAYRYYANVPRAIQVETVRRIVAELGGQVSRAEAGRAADRLWRFENASLGGVLAVPGSERLEKIGLEVRVWRFRPEPPRRVH
ncbi:tRNA lysidine(34) synthetase TilS [Erythrobacter sp.]|uniref:tRNA lysidine(34) synthetase TilS n=1 Tax=Erythrobacter sp. TaxID=1042 RepID=UPI00345BFC35